MTARVKRRTIASFIGPAVLALAMVGIAFAENRFFGTAITAPKLFGILLVIAGIAVISRQ